LIHTTAENGLYVHVPTPGDHYSEATGSATMTVIYELSREHQKAGGQTRIVVGRNTRHDYSVGDCTEVHFHGLPTTRERLLDAALGRLGFTRRFATATYEPALAAIEADFEGPVFLHNSLAPLRSFRARRPRVRWGLYAHNTLFRTFARRELRETIAKADFVVCVSTFLAEDLARRLGSASHNLRVVPNGVDLERFYPALRPGDVEEPVVLFVGRVIPEKGPDILLRAARKLLGGRRQFRVRIVGSRGFSATDPLSSYERSLRRLAEPIHDFVAFEPFVDRRQVLAEYQHASIFCAPSNCDEGFSLTVPEALACGLPTIAARRGGIPEAGGDAVLYFRPPSVDELAERLAYLIDDASARDEWGRRARAHAVTLSWSEQYQKLRAAVEE
jgi:glycosyltransferase involved in cell wall biosynthesis